MLDIVLLRKDLDAAVARLQTRKNPQSFLNVDAFRALEGERKTLQTRTEELQSQRNSLSKQIGMLKGKGQHAEADAVMAQVTAIKDELDASAQRLDVLQAELQTLLLAVPTALNQEAPRVRIGGRLASVSTLLMTVGRPQSPLTAGKGGRGEGMPRLPSIDSIIADSSPQIYAPAPRRNSINGNLNGGFA